MFLRLAMFLLVVQLAVLVPSCRFDASSPTGLKFSGGEDVLDVGGRGDAVLDAADVLGDLDGQDVAADSIPGDETGPAEIVDVLLPDACDCDDGIACTVDTCVKGKCEHVPDDSLCQKGGECITWHCDAVKDCQMEAHQGQPCTNANLCAQNPHCNEKGECVYDGIKACPVEMCLENGQCDPATGECTYDEMGDSPCDDGNPCTQKDHCIEGKCQGEFVSAECKCTSDEECAAFEDGNLCNGTLRCVDELCTVDLATVVTCPESPSPCIEIWCQPATGECLDESLGQETPCDDSNPCTKDDKCDIGGSCKGAALADGTSCNTDESLCTVEACQDGNCEQKEAVACPALPQCVDNVCQPKTGKCLGQAWPDGTSCDDGDPCTKGESCANGTCQGGFDVCVDCGKSELAGHPCDDGIDETVGDFCFNLKCTGWLDATWSVSAATQTGLLRVTSTPDLVHFTGLHDKGDPSPTVYFVKADGKAKLSVTNSALEQPFADLDGPVAVGPPSPLYYYTGGFFQANSSFKNAVKKVCTGIGDAYRPSSVAQRTYSSMDGVKPGFSEMVAVGFEVAADIAPAGSCVLAVCGRNEGGVWACTPIRPADIVLGSGLLHPAVSAIWLPEEQGACDAPTPACFTKQALHAAVSHDKAQGGRWVKVIDLKYDQDSAKFVAKALIEQDYPAGQTAAVIRALLLDQIGNLFAAGTQGFLASRMAGTGKVTLFPKFASLGGGTPHYEGIYVNGNGVLLATNVIANKVDPNGGQYLEIRAGLLAGPPSLLLEGGGAMPYFNQVYKIQTCLDCGAGPLGSLGLTDLAAIKDHLGSTVIPGQLPFVLVLSATVPDSVTTLLRGHGLFLPL